MWKAKKAGGGVREPNRAWRSLVSDFDIILLSGKSVAGVTFFYGGAVALLGLSDLLLAHLIPAREYGSYQFVRSLAPLLVLASLLGLDQVLPREFAGASAHEKDWYALVGRFVRRGLGLAVLAASGSVALLGLPIIAAGSLAATVPAIACSELAAAYLRSVGQYPKAALLQQAYRVLLASIVLASVPWASYISSVYPVGLAAASFLAGFAALRVLLKTKGRNRLSLRDVRRLTHTGVLFAISTISLGALDWVDQAALALRFSSFSDIGLYVALKVYLNFPFVTLVSIAGFSALPEVAKSPERMSLTLFNKLQRRMIVLASTAALSLYVLFQKAPELLPVKTEATILVLFLGSGMLRFLYLLPSSVLGALAPRSTLRRYTCFVVLSVILEAMIIILLPIDSLEPIAMGGFGLLAGTATRLGSSWIFASACLQRSGTFS
jgi:hypothetical protein